MKKIMETERTCLREFTKDDFENLCGILQDEKTMYAYEHAFSEEEVWDWLNRQLERYQKDGLGLWAVTDKSSGIFLGQAGLTMQNTGHTEEMEIGYLFNRKYWHMGFATECAKALKQYAFSSLGQNKVVSVIRDSNHASRRVAERNGMEIESTFTKHYYGMDMPHLVYAVYKKENEIN